VFGLYVPSGHRTGAPAPTGQYLPAGHTPYATSISPSLTHAHAHPLGSASAGRFSPSPPSVTLRTTAAAASPRTGRNGVTDIIVISESNGGIVLVIW
jgi:hypothetical protein